MIHDRTHRRAIEAATKVLQGAKGISHQESAEAVVIAYLDAVEAECESKAPYSLLDDVVLWVVGVLFAAAMVLFACVGVADFLYAIYYAAENIF